MKLVFDDIPALKENIDVHGATSLSSLLEHDYWGAPMDSSHSHKSYRPLTVLSFRVNCLQAQEGTSCLENLSVFHGTSVLLHGIVCVAVVGLMRSVGGRAPAATVTGLLFATHPIHSEAVASLVGRADILCLGASILALVAFAAAVRARSSLAGVLWIALALACTLCSALCKEVGFTTFGIFLIYDLLEQIPRPQLRPPTPGLGPFLLRQSVVWGVCAAAVHYRLSLHGETFSVTFDMVDNPLAAAEGGTFLWSALYTHARYLWLLLCPSTLSADYSFNAIPLLTHKEDVRHAASIAAYTGVLLVMAIALQQMHISKRQSRSRGQSAGLPALAVVLLAGPLVPASHLPIKVGTVVAERLLYAPSLGFAMLSASVPWRRRWVQRVVLAVVLALYSTRALVRNRDWSSSVSLWNATVQAVPRSAKAWKGLSDTLLSQGDVSGALEAASCAIEIHPHYGEGLGALGYAQYKAGYLQPAVNSLRASLELNPGQYQQAINLGAAHMQMGQVQEAWDSHSRALALNPAKVAAYNNLGLILMQTGDWRQAVEVFRAGVRAEPQGEDVFAAWYNIGNAYNQDGADASEAVKGYNEALQLRPGMAEVYFNMAVAHHSLRDMPKAADALQASTQLQPDDPAAYQNLGLVLQALGRSAEGEMASAVAAALRAPPSGKP